MWVIFLLNVTKGNVIITSLHVFVILIDCSQGGVLDMFESFSKIFFGSLSWIVTFFSSSLLAGLGSVPDNVICLFSRSIMLSRSKKRSKETI